MSPSTRRLAEALLSDVESLTERLLAAIFTGNPEWADYARVPRDDLQQGRRDYPPVKNRFILAARVGI
jgi:hypothetical protein